jgi:hypothetical protein
MHTNGFSIFRTDSALSWTGNPFRGDLQRCRFTPQFSRLAIPRDAPSLPLPRQLVDDPPCVLQVGRSTLSRFLRSMALNSHRVRYALELGKTFPVGTVGAVHSVAVIVQ